MKNPKTHKTSLFWISVTSCCSACFVLFYVFVLYGLFCHGAFKLDLSTLFTTFFFERLFNLYWHRCCFFESHILCVFLCSFVVFIECFNYICFSQLFQIIYCAKKMLIVNTTWKDCKTSKVRLEPVIMLKPAFHEISRQFRIWKLTLKIFIIFIKGKLSDSFTNYNYVGNTKVSVSIKKKT